MGKRQLGVAWGTGQRAKTSGVLTGGGAALKEAFWENTRDILCCHNKKEGVTGIYWEGCQKCNMSYKHGTMSHNSSKSSTSHMKF